MITEKLQLIDEQTSPLFRIMSVYNAENPAKRLFDNNICAFHIGNGIILSVAHNLRSDAQIFKSIDEHLFQTEVFSRIDPSLQMLFESSYSLDKITGKRYLNATALNDLQMIIGELQRINFDTRWISLSEKNISKPYLIVQFRTNEFYQDPKLTMLFDSNLRFSEPDLNRHTFLIELELITPFYSDDIAMYRIVNTHPDIIKRVSSIDPDFSIQDDVEKLYCLQSAPTSALGKLLNNASIEGVTDHWSLFQDRFDGNYIMEGNRYLIKGYFRFGSSGAPYIIYDRISGTFKANAIQSEACPIQLAINGNQNGNFQFVNAIASPLYNVQNEVAPQLHLIEHLRL